MNNSIFGKTIENIRKRQNIILVDNRQKAVKLISRPNFDRATIFDKNLIAVHMKKTEVYFNKPVYVGQAILDLSKTLIFITTIFKRNINTGLSYCLKIPIA